MAIEGAGLATAQSQWRRVLDQNRELLTIYGILGITSCSSGLSHFRISGLPANIFNVLRQAVSLGLVSVGQTLAILVGGIDLSVGATISLIGVYTTGLMAKYTEASEP